jgi:hypothetical protein
VDIVENVEKLSTKNGDNSPITAYFVENVEKLSTENVDNSPITACFVESVEKLSTENVDNSTAYDLCGKCGKVIHNNCG